MNSLTSTRSSRWLPRFGLRALLIAFTAFAIGFPTWYRWPYQEEELQYAMRQGAPDKTRPPQKKVATTWRRQWGGGRLKHGTELTYLRDKLVLRVTYRDGILHGPYETWQDNENHEIGRYVEGKRGGEWKQFDSAGNLRRSAHWLNDRLHGKCLVVARSGRKQALEFVEGRIMQADGRKINDRLKDALRSGTIDDKRIATALASPFRVALRSAPLKDATDYIGAVVEIPVVLDHHCVDPMQPISSDWDGLELWWLLAIIGSDHDLGFDHRYGCLWITSAADAENWKDPTGVANLVPPSESQLARAWASAAEIRTRQQPIPLADALESYLVTRPAIAYDVSNVRAKHETDNIFPVSVDLVGLRLHDVLGQMLYQARCRCELRGETLVVLPQELEERGSDGKF